VHPRDLGIVFIAVAALVSLVLCLLAAGTITAT